MKLFLLAVMLIVLAGCQSGVERRDGYWADQRHHAPGARPRVKVIVIHYTAGDLPSSLATLTDRSVSAHYLIPRQPPQRSGKGVILQLVPESELAWHAGPSFWRGATRINDTSVGIELVNSGYQRTLTGREWQPYSAAQIRTLAALLQDIARRYHIAPENIVGHSDIAPQRKQDPGPLFPWRELAQQGMGAWPDRTRVEYYLAGTAASAPVAMAVMLEALGRYGYDVQSAVTPRQQQTLVAAFQMHFRPADYRGQPDSETLAIARALLEKQRSAY